MRRAIAVALLSAGLLGTVGLRTSWACSCDGVPDEQEFRAAQLVFVGVVTAREQQAPSSVGPDDPTIWRAEPPLIWTFEIESVQKGPAGEIQRMRSASEGSCGFGFEVGRRYQVFGTPGDPGSTGLCSGTRALSSGDAPYEPAAPTALIVGAVLGALVLAWSFRRIREMRVPSIEPGPPPPMD